MELIEFTWSAISGGVVYDGIKSVLGKSYEKLKSFADGGKKDEFTSHLETIFSVNEQIKKQLEELQKSSNLNIKVGKGIGYIETMNGDISING